MSAQPEAFFLPADSGQRFCLFHPARGDVTRGLLLYIHPFAEEMNKARRMAALQARALAGAGYAVLQIDLHGCGDSSGDFGDATWPGWVSDVASAARWLRARSDAPLWLWGLRAGCLLASEAARQLDEACHFLLWQPATAGKPLLQQFLRLKVAGDMLAGNAKGIMESLRQQLSQGKSVEIAGYTLSAGLASGLERSVLTAPERTGRVEWIELTSRPGASLPPASVQTLERWHQAGVSVRSQIAAGPAFWQTSEIEEAPALLTATLAALAAPVTA